MSAGLWAAAVVVAVVVVAVVVFGPWYGPGDGDR